MNAKTCLPAAIMILAFAASPALAQSGVGGPTRPINHVGGASTHPNPVLPPAKGTTANVVQPKPTRKK